MLSKQPGIRVTESSISINLNPNIVVTTIVNYEFPFSIIYIKFGLVRKYMDYSVHAPHEKTYDLSF
jgi:hypothetical protein